MVLGELLRSFGLVGIWVRMVMRFVGMNGYEGSGYDGFRVCWYDGLRVYG